MCASAWSVVEAVAVLSAVSEDLVVLQPADRMLDPRTDPAMFRVVGFLTGQRGCEVSLGARTVRAGVSEADSRPLPLASAQVRA